MKVKNLLKTPKQWTRKAFARNKYGHGVYPKCKNAVKWCVVGAIERCYPANKQRQTRLKLKQTIDSFQEHKGLGLLGFNDSASFEDVKKVLKKADI